MSFFNKIRKQKLLSLSLMLFTLSIGIVLGTLVSTGVKAAKDQAVAPGATPLTIPNPVQLSKNMGVAHVSSETMSGGLARSSTASVAVHSASISVPDSSGSGFDWTAAAIGAALGGMLMLVLAAGVGFRRRGQLAT